MQEVPADSGNFPWYMTDSIAVLLLEVYVAIAYNFGGGGGGGGGGAYIRD